METEKNEMERLDKERLEHRDEIEEAAAESSQIRILDNRVSSLIESLKGELEETDVSITTAIHKLDLDGDGVLSQEELLQAMESIAPSKRPDAQQFQQLVRTLDQNEDGKITVAELRDAIAEMEMREDPDDDEPVTKRKNKQKEAS